MELVRGGVVASRMGGLGATLVITLLACGRGPDEPAEARVPSEVVDGRQGALAQPVASLEGSSKVEVELESDVEPEPEVAPKPQTPVVALPGPDDVPPTHFEGREIAQTMSHWGAGWLTRPERDAEEDTTRLHQALGLREGQTACDVGAGSGYHTVLLARAVGPTGRVLAVDLQPRMLELLRERVAAAGLHNVETIEATPSDPRLPADTCDLVLLVDVYHELSWPEPMLAAFGRALTPTGRLALVEFRAEDPDVPIKRLHKLSKAQIDRELLPRGFVRVETFDGLPWQHLVFFAREDPPAR